jgi:hypothetical protein
MNIIGADPSFLIGRSNEIEALHCVKCTIFPGNRFPISLTHIIFKVTAGNQLLSTKNTNSADINNPHPFQFFDKLNIFVHKTSTPLIFDLFTSFNKYGRE